MDSLFKLIEDAKVTSLDEVAELRGQLEQQLKTDKGYAKRSVTPTRLLLGISDNGSRQGADSHRTRQVETKLISNKQSLGQPKNFHEAELFESLSKSNNGGKIKLILSLFERYREVCPPTNWEAKQLDANLQGEVDSILQAGPVTDGHQHSDITGEEISSLRKLNNRLERKCEDRKVSLKKLYYIVKEKDRQLKGVCDALEKVRDGMNKMGEKMKSLSTTTSAKIQVIETRVELIEAKVRKGVEDHLVTKEAKNDLLFGWGEATLEVINRVRDEIDRTRADVQNQIQSSSVLLKDLVKDAVKKQNRSRSASSSKKKENTADQNLDLIKDYKLKLSEAEEKQNELESLVNDIEEDRQKAFVEKQEIENFNQELIQRLNEQEEENNALTNKITELEAELSNTEKPAPVSIELQQNEDKINKLNELITELRRELDHKTNEIQELDSLNHKLHEENENTHNQWLEVETELKADLEEAEKGIRQLTKQLDQERDLCTKLRRKSEAGSELSQKIIDLQAKLHQLEIEKENWEGYKKESIREIKELNQLVEDLRAELQTYKDAQANHQEGNVQMQQKLLTLSEEINQLKLNKTSLENELNTQKTAYENKLNHNESDLASLSLKYQDESKKSASLEVQNKSLQQIIEESKHKQSRLEQELDAYKSAAQQSAQEVKKLLKEVETKEEQINSLQSGLIEKSDKLDQLQSQLDLLAEGKKEVQKETSEEQTKAQSELAIAKKEEENLLKNLGEREQELAESSNIIQNLKKVLSLRDEELDSLKEDLTKSQSNFEEAKVAKEGLLKELEKAKVELKSLQSRLEKADQSQQSTNELGNFIEELKRKLESKEKEVESLNNDTEALQHEIDGFKSDNDELRDEVAQFESKEKNLLEERDLLSSKVEQLSEEVQALNAQAETAAQELKYSIEKVNAAETDLKRERETSLELRKQITESESNSAKIQQELEKKSLEFDAMKEEFETKQSELETELAHVQGIATEVGGKNNEIDRLSDENQRLALDVNQKNALVDKIKEELKKSKALLQESEKVKEDEHNKALLQQSEMEASVKKEWEKMMTKIREVQKELESANEAKEHSETRMKEAEEKLVKLKEDSSKAAKTACENQQKTQNEILKQKEELKRLSSVVTEMEETLKLHQQKVSELEQDLKIAKNTNRELSDSLSDEVSRVKLMQQEVDNLNKRMEDQKLETENREASLKAQNEATEAEKTKLIEEANGYLTEAKGEIEELQSEVEGCKRDIQQKDMEILKLKEANADLDGQLQDKRQQIKRLDEDIRKGVKDSSGIIKGKETYINQIETRLKQKEDELDISLKKNAALEKKLHEQKEETNGRDEVIETLNENINLIGQELNQLKSSTKLQEEEIRSLKKQNRDLEESAKSMKAVVEREKGLNTDKSKFIEDQKVEIDKLSQQLKAAQDEKVADKKKFNEKVKELQKLKDEDAENREANKDLEKRSHEAQQECEMLRKQVHDLEVKVDLASNREAELKQKLSKLKEEFEKEKEREKVEIEEIQKEKDQGVEVLKGVLEREREDRKKEKSALQKEIDSLKEEITKEKRGKEFLEQEQVKLNKTREADKEYREKAQQMIEKYKREISDKDEELRICKLDLIRLGEQVDTAEEELMRMKEQENQHKEAHTEALFNVSELELEISQLRSQLASTEELRDHVDVFQRQIDNLNHELVEKNTTISDLKRQLREAHLAHERMTADCVAAKEKWNRADEEIQKVLKERDAKDALANQVTIEKNNLKQQLEKAQIKANEASKLSESETALKTAAQATVKELKEKIKTLEQSQSEDTASKLKELESQIAKQKAQLDNLRSQGNQQALTVSTGEKLDMCWKLLAAEKRIQHLKASQTMLKIYVYFSKPKVRKCKLLQKENDKLISDLMVQTQKLIQTEKHRSDMEEQLSAKGSQLDQAMQASKTQQTLRSEPDMNLSQREGSLDSRRNIESKIQTMSLVFKDMVLACGDILNMAVPPLENLNDRKWDTFIPNFKSKLHNLKIEADDLKINIESYKSLLDEQTKENDRLKEILNNRDSTQPVSPNFDRSLSAVMRRDDSIQNDPQNNSINDLVIELDPKKPKKDLKDFEVPLTPVDNYSGDNLQDRDPSDDDRSPKVEYDMPATDTERIMLQADNNKLLLKVSQLNQDIAAREEELDDLKELVREVNSKFGKSEVQKIAIEEATRSWIDILGEILSGKKTEVFETKEKMAWEKMSQTFEWSAAKSNDLRSKLAKLFAKKKGFF